MPAATFDIAAELPNILQKAIAWAEAEAASARTNGASLKKFGIRLARSVGVQRPELIRVIELPELPFPNDPYLALAANKTGLIGPGAVGLTLGYAVFILIGYRSNRLLSHEFRHVYQYESAGSIAAFLPLYLSEILSYGYEDAPYEIDAVAHEIDTPRWQWWK